MQLLPPDLYARWRDANRGTTLLAEVPPAAAPPERVVQQIWLHQRLRPEALRTLDGRPVRVLHPGFWNHEAGPDFRQAVIEIGETLHARCDVEVDLAPGAWHQHGHDRNPAYATVGLHVVWRSSATGTPGGLPTLPLADAVDATPGELVDWARNVGRDLPLSAKPGCCAAPLAPLPEAALAELLEQAGLVRLRSKAELLETSARHAGWEQALWEGLFAALGYKHNTWPMRRLAGAIARVRDPGDGATEVRALQARLLGLAGLLPDELTRTQPDVDAYLRLAWDVWWRWRSEAAPEALPRLAWCLHGVRPANHPQRRLALAAHWLAAPAWTTRLESWLKRDLADSELHAALCDCLQPAQEDAFWTRHWTLQSAPMKRPKALLGGARATDLALNVILPWLWSRAVASKSVALHSRVERRCRAWPAMQDNAVLRLARQRLLGNRPLPRPTRAVHQQGLLQIVRDFCEPSDALCTDCEFPALLGGIASPRAAGSPQQNQAGCGA